MCDCKHLIIIYEGTKCIEMNCGRKKEGYGLPCFDCDTGYVLCPGYEEKEVKIRDRKIKEGILKEYLDKVRDLWYVPDGYIFVTNIGMKNEYAKKWCKCENPTEYSWAMEVIEKYRERYGDVQVVDICSDINGYEWKGSEITQYDFGDVYDICDYDVSLYVPIKNWLNAPFE